MPMNELIRAGLFGLGLIEVKTAAMVRRYNDCLEYLGLPRTKRRKFKIDKIGWSPEIAADLEDDYYMSRGSANPYWIVIVPEQRNAPIYYPNASYDWDLAEAWFATNWNQVVELTKHTGICIDLDQSIDAYRAPEDLLLITEVKSKATTPAGLMGIAQAQSQLVHRLMTETEGYRDDELVASLLESKQAHGDLRGKSLVISDGHFTDLSDFYWRVFGGTFVLRSHTGTPMVICREKKQVQGHPKLHVANSDVIPLLIEHGYVGTDLGWWQDHLWRLRIIQESFLMDMLDEAEPEIEFLSLNSPQQKAIIAQYAKQLDMYLEIGECIKQLEMDTVPDIADDLMIHMLHPSVGLSNSSQRVVWHLLTYLGKGRNVVRYYRHQKTAFVQSYTTKWNKPKREWARVRIREHYEHASNSHNRN